jgi:hypothetical protein
VPLLGLVLTATIFASNTTGIAKMARAGGYPATLRSDFLIVCPFARGGNSEPQVPAVIVAL